MGNRWGNSGNSVRLYFGGAPKSLQMVTSAMKLKDTYSQSPKVCSLCLCSSYVYYQVWSRSPAQVGCMRQVLRAGALGRPREMGWGGRWEGESGWGIHVTPWLIHVNVWQKPLQSCKVISLQLIKINGKKKESSPTSQFKSINFSMLSFLHSPTLTSIHDHWINHSLDQMALCWWSNVSAF